MGPTLGVSVAQCYPLYNDAISLTWSPSQCIHNGMHKSGENIALCETTALTMLFIRSTIMCINTQDSRNFSHWAQVGAEMFYCKKLDTVCSISTQNADPDMWESDVEVLDFDDIIRVVIDTILTACPWSAELITEAQKTFIKTIYW